MSRLRSKKIEAIPDSKHRSRSCVPADHSILSKPKNEAELETLGPDFADQVLKLEFLVEKHCRLDDIQKLLDLYSRAVEHYNSRGDERFMDFKERIHRILTRDEVLDEMTRYEVPLEDSLNSSKTPRQAADDSGISSTGKFVRSHTSNMDDSERKLRRDTSVKRVGNLKAKNLDDLKDMSSRISSQMENECRVYVDNAQKENHATGEVLKQQLENQNQALMRKLEQRKQRKGGMNRTISAPYVGASNNLAASSATKISSNLVARDTGESPVFKAKRRQSGADTEENRRHMMKAQSFVTKNTRFTIEDKTTESTTPTSARSKPLNFTGLTGLGGDSFVSDKPDMSRITAAINDDEFEYEDPTEELVKKFKQNLQNGSTSNGALESDRSAGFPTHHEGLTTKSDFSSDESDDEDEFERDPENPRLNQTLHKFDRLVEENITSVLEEYRKHLKSIEHKRQAEIEKCIEDVTAEKYERISEIKAHYNTEIRQMDQDVSPIVFQMIEKMQSNRDNEVEKTRREFDSIKSEQLKSVKARYDQEEKDILERLSLTQIALCKSQFKDSLTKLFVQFSSGNKTSETVTRQLKTDFEDHSTENGKVMGMVKEEDEQDFNKTEGSGATAHDMMREVSDANTSDLAAGPAN
eukprot:CAMPEP_0115031832 /NCGR_PEP_ID=MMETSP0216-20121206/38791_1 /TAXON_ID=223996 /ORGANISM="Protocruzia adherens, Strain Boccale" /LENGTH=638 /DNA_ID=CAMNT_0002409603 /DNA_START=53 /DNA_END=1969 /DNA_ORIENTATION=-